MPRRPITMVAFGATTPTRGQRVPSSTCPKPSLPTHGTQTGEASLYQLESETPLSGAEKHVAEMLLDDHSISYDEAEQAMLEIWNG